MHVSKILRNKQGIALLTVILIFLVMVVLLGGMTLLSQGNFRNSQVSNEHTAAYYAAEAGLTAVSDKLDQLLGDSYDNNVSADDLLVEFNDFVTENKVVEFELTNNNGAQTVSNVIVEDLGTSDDGYRRVKFTSIGRVGNISRKIKRDLMFKYVKGEGGSGFTVNKSVMVKDTFTLKGSAKVLGAPISTYSTESGAIDLAWSTSVPGIEIPVGTEKLDIVKAPNNLHNIITSGGINGIVHNAKVYDFPSITMPVYPHPSTLSRLPRLVIQHTQWNSTELVDSQGNFTQRDCWMLDNRTYTLPDTSVGYYVPRFSTSCQVDFTFDVGNSDKFLVVDELRLDGFINVVGNGTLTIYVRGNTQSTATSNESHRLSFGYTSNKSLGRASDPSKLMIYVDPIYVRKSQGNRVTYENLEVKFNGNAPYYLSIMAANLNIELGGSGQIHGYVVTGGDSIKFVGNSNAAVALYYAPNAHVSVAGSAKVNGAVLANSFEAVGSGTVNYQDVQFENFPFEVLNPITGGHGSGNPILSIIEGPTIEE